MNKKNLILFGLLALNLALTMGVIVFVTVTHLSGDTSNAKKDGTETYTLYIGLNDKESYTQEIATDEARAIVDGICLKYVDGFTSSEAQGGWTDETGAITHENTLVYEFCGADEEQITAVMDEVLVALNQNSILVRRESTDSYFYSKAK